MSEQNRTAPRWQDAREHALKLLREERDSIAAELPQVENVDERELFDAWLARVDLALATIGAIDDAALARLAEPAQPTAAERWRAVPAEDRERALSVVVGARCDAARWVASATATYGAEHSITRNRVRHLAALDALLALAREAEGGGV